jgi:hypothetical protein
VDTLENKVLAAAAARTHIEVRDLLAISVAQTAVLLAIALVVGQWAARKLGLGTPLIAALLTRRPAPEKTVSTLLIAVALGIVTALALMMLDHWVFAPIPSVAKLIQNAESGSAKPSAWQGLLASFYGAVDEEILMRLPATVLYGLKEREPTQLRVSCPSAISRRPIAPATLARLARLAASAGGSEASQRAAVIRFPLKPPSRLK